MSEPVFNPWKAKRFNFSSDGFGWWQIYQRWIDDHGMDKGIKVIAEINISTQSDEIPEIVQEILDAHNTRPTPDTGIGQAVELLTRIGQKMVRVIYQGEKFTEADCEEIRCTLNPSRLAPCHKEPS